MSAFIPLHYQDRLTIINPKGDVGIVTFWSPPRTILNRLDHLGIDLETDRSRVAVVGTLYGEGLPHLLRNLLYNPQIRYLALFGALLDGGVSKEGLRGFFNRGLEETIELGTRQFRVVGTDTIIDGGVQRRDFPDPPRLVDLGTPTDSESAARIKRFFNELAPQREPEQPRRESKIPEVGIQRLPSDPRAHTIVATTPMGAWKELIHRLLHFGHEVALKKGRRIELQNVKVTINQPLEESESTLKAHGFSLSRFQDYQKNIVSPLLPPGATYAYGHRLRRYFASEKDDSSGDTLSRVVDLLKADVECRKAYISLWDSRRDLLSGEKGHPCLISLYFRKFEERLTLTAVFRTHNALTAWPENVYGLIAVQRLVAEKAGMEPGPVTVMSHSISIDPAGGTGKAKAKMISELRNRELERQGDAISEDPNGYFQISVDHENFTIIVKHQFKGITLHTYRGDSAVEIERHIVADLAVSDISHALYLGRELARAEMRLKNLMQKQKRS